MATRFEYGTGRIGELEVRAVQPGEKPTPEVLVRGMPTRPTQRFWTSLQVRFGFSANVFTYFSHREVFDRIGRVAPNDRVRWCVERPGRGPARLLAVTNPAAPLLPHDALCGLLDRYGGADVAHADGVVTSMHTPRGGGAFTIAGDAFENRFMLQVPIDGYGRPAVYLSLQRQICANGAVARGPAFRSELALGRGGDAVEYALVRALDGFHHEEGYAALRQRFESAARSWASVNEANRLYRVLVRLHGGGLAAGDGGAAPALVPAFHRLTGDLSRIYGLANPEALSAKRQRTLPVACKVYDLLNFASEVATHHAAPAARAPLQLYLAGLLAAEYDLEGTADQFGDFRDFFLRDAAAAEAHAALHRRS